MSAILVRTINFAADLLNNAVPSKKFTVDGINTKMSFSDMITKEWYTEYVNDAVALELMKGYDDGTFRPDANISRAEAATVFNRFFGKIDELIGTME